MLVIGLFSLCPFCLLIFILSYLSPSATVWLNVILFVLLYEESCHGINFTRGFVLWSYLCTVKRRLARPVKHVLVDVAIIATQHGVEHLVTVVEGVHQRHGIGPHLGQDVFQALGDAGELRDCQQASLKGTVERSSTRRTGG